MSTALAERPKIPESDPQQPESIFRYYSVPNEIDFLHSEELSHLSVTDKRFYTEENVYRFLGEFAGKVPYTQLSFLQDGDGAITFAGIDVTESYRKTAELGGDREKDELKGYERIQHGFAHEGANFATWLSPSISEYGLVMHFARDPDNPRKVTEHVLRYDERRGDIDRSQSILDTIDPSQRHESGRGFLQNPIVGVSPHDPKDDLNYVMRAVGIDEEKIRKSAQFEARIRTELSQWVTQYVEEVMSEHANAERAEFILAATFNKAKEIAAAINNNKPAEYAGIHIHNDDGSDQNLAAAMYQYGMKSATVVGGGSCPSVSKKNKVNMLSQERFFDSLKQGISPKKMFEDDETEHFVCPKCDYHATGPVGDECPNCHLTKEEFAKNGGDICDDGTSPASADNGQFAAAA